MDLVRAEAALRAAHAARDTNSARKIAEAMRAARVAPPVAEPASTSAFPPDEVPARRPAVVAPTVTGGIGGPAVSSTAPPQDSWATVGRKFIENIPATARQIGGGLAQTLGETIPSPPAEISPYDPQWQAGVVEPAKKFIAAPGGLDDFGKRVYEEAATELKANAPNVDPDSAKGYAYDIAQSMAQMVPAIVTSIATKSPGPGLTVMGAQVWGQKYGEARAEGRTPDQAAQDAAFYTLAETIPETIPLGILTREGTKFLPRVLKATGAEGLQEMFTQSLEVGYDAGVLDKDMTWGEAWEQIKRAGIVGGLTGGGLAVATQPLVREPELPAVDESQLPQAPPPIVEPGEPAGRPIDATSARTDLTAFQQAAAEGTSIEPDAARRQAAALDAFRRNTPLRPEEAVSKLEAFQRAAVEGKRDLSGEGSGQFVEPVTAEAKPWERYASSGEASARFEEEVRAGVEPSAQPEPPVVATPPQPPQSPVERVEPAEAPMPAPEAVSSPGEAVAGGAGAGEFDEGLALRAYSHISHSPEKRAQQEKQDFENEVGGLRDQLTKLGAPDAWVAGKINDYRREWLRRYYPVLHAKSRTMSPMIAGPAKFPTRRNQKKLETEQKRWQEFSQWRDKARKEAVTAAKAARSPERVEADKESSFRKSLARAITDIADVDTGRFKGFNRGTFVANVSKVIRNAPDPAAALEETLRLQQRLLDGGQITAPIFRPNHPVMKLRKAVAADQPFDLPDLPPDPVDTQARDRRAADAEQKVKQVQDHLRRGGKVTNRTALSTLTLTSPDQIRFRKRADGVGTVDVMERGKWVGIFNVDALAEQAPTAAKPPLPAARRAAKAAAAARPASLFDFIASTGGIRDDGGELKAMDLHKRMVPRKGRLVRAKGRGPDYVREAAVEAGYLPEGASINDLLTAMDREARGSKVYPDNVQSAVDQAASTLQAEEANDQLRLDVQSYAADLGETLTDAEVDEIVATMSRDGLDAETAVADFAERLAVDALEQGAEETGDDAYEDIPFAAGQAEGAGVAGPAGEGRAGEPRDAAAGAAGGEVAEEGGRAEERYEVGRSLTPEQRKQTLDSLVDRYKEMGLQKEHYVDARGEDRSRFPHSPDLFIKSDITGAMLRYYVTLPDGRLAHPTELFPDYTQTQVDKEMARREGQARETRAWVQSRTKPEQQFDTLDEARRYWRQKSDASRAESAGGWPTVYGPDKRDAFTNGEKVVLLPAGPEWLTGDRLEALADAGWRRQPGDRPEITTELTPEGEQTVLPGAEQISQRETIERRMAGRDVRKGQKGLEGAPLFDEGGRAEQDDMFGSTRSQAASTPTKGRPKLHPSWQESARRPATRAELDPLATHLERLIRKINPDPALAVEFRDQMLATGDTVARHGVDPSKTYEQTGAYVPLLHLIRLSLSVSQGERVGAAAHEAWHSVERLLTEPERATLLAAYPTQTTDAGKLSHVERTAIAFEEFILGKFAGKPAIRRIFAKLRDFLRRLGNWLQARGFQTVEDVFTRAAAGEVGGRHEALPAGDVTVHPGTGRPVTGLRRGQKLSSLRDQTKTAAFKKWFGDSKVVDATGEPLVVYHGTADGIETFRPGKGIRHGHGKQMRGIFFSQYRSTAAGYARTAVNARDASADGPGVVVAAYVSLKNPRVFKDLDAFRDARRAELESEGHDGAIRLNDDGDMAEVVAFRPEQIKSAIGNDGTFDPNDPSILSRIKGAKKPAAPRELDDGPPLDLKTFAAIRKQVISPTARNGAQARQRAMSRGFSLRQPIDKVFRIPFHLFGGINQRGEWKWGSALSARAEHVITGAKFSDTGRFAFINPALEKARMGLVDRYGLDPEYVELDRRRGLNERAIASEVPELMATLKDHKIGGDEAKVLQAVLTGEAVPDAAMAKLAAPIRAAIDDLGQAAVQLGLVSAEAVDRNRGAYIHRVYLKHETDEPALVRWMSDLMGARRRRIIGSQFKGRGLWMEVHPSRLKNLAAKAGDKVRVLAKPDAAGRRRTILQKANAKIPAGHTDRGVYEVRGDNRGKAVLWRDYTKAERLKMGEIVDARYTIAKTYMLMATDLANGRFFKDISQNPDWATDTEPAGEWVEASDYNRRWADPDVEWVKVPDTKIAKSNTKRYASLGGKFVRAEVWRDIAELDAMQRPGLWRGLLTQWKLNKTARNPVVHMNNIMSNVALMDLADVRAGDLVAGINAMVRQTAEYHDAVRHGAFGSDMVAQEIRRNILRPLLEEIQRDMLGMGPVQARFGVVGKLAEGIWGKVKAADRAMLRGYQLEDEVFRMATYMRRRALGVPAVEAALEARDQFLNYDIRAPWVNAARNTVLPFISYTYRAAPIVARAVAQRPWKLAKYATLAYVAQQLAYEMFPPDDDDDGERERRSLREQEQGNTWIGAPRMIRLPWGDQYGNPMFLDIRRWIPAGDVFDLGQGNAAWPIPAPLMFGGPLMIAGELLLNRSAFTGNDIVNDATDDLWDKTSKVGDFLWKSWMPSAPWIPGSWYWERIGNAINGARDWQGRPYSVPQALSSSVGIKIKSQDVEDGMSWHQREFDHVERELKAQMRRLSTDRSLERLSEEDYEDGLNELIEKLDRLIDKRIETETGEDLSSLDGVQDEQGQEQGFAANGADNQSNSQQQQAQLAGYIRAGNARQIAAMRPSREVTLAAAQQASPALAAILREMPA